MNEIANATTQEVSVIEGLAMQARALRLSINVNMWQLARVFIEAKELVPHGEWKGWLEENADVSVRTAEDMIASYKRFVGRAPFEALSPSQTFKLLPLPAGTEDQFMAEHDVASMTTRQIQEAVKQARAEAQARIDEAEARVRELENQEPTIPDEVMDELRRGREDLAEARESANHFAELARRTASEKAEVERQNRSLRADLSDAEQSIQEQQEALNHAQEELLNMQSAQARGDAEHAPVDELTLEVFRVAVRDFMGACARMPYMNGTFSVMPQQTKNSYNELLRTIEGWCESSRRAMESVAVEGGVFVG